MNLQHLIDQYIAHRRSLGEQQGNNGCHLRAFGRFIGPDATIADVSSSQVNAFLAGKGPITLNWHVKLSVLRAFYQYAVSRGYATTSPLPAVTPKRPPAFVPYIYSREELRSLLHAAKSDDRYRAITRPPAMYAVLLLLCGTGLRVQELVDLDLGDINFTDSTLTVRQSKFGKTRLVPFGPQLHQVLQDYAARHRKASVDTAFFISRHGRRINTDTLRHNFKILCEQAGIQRHDGGRYQPRIHDLRHTFAVHRLTAWYRDGADVQTLLPHLSIYLGHVHLRHTQVYLTMTPELLEEAADRFEQYAKMEISHD